MKRIPQIFRCSSLVVLLAAVLTVAPESGFADEGIPRVECAVGKSVQGLTAAEQEAVSGTDKTVDPVVSEYRKRWGPPAAPPKPPRTDNALDIEWSQAKRMIYTGLVRAVIQTHARDVYLISASGKSYKTREPSLDDVFRAASVVDPCHRYVDLMTE